MSEPKQRDPLDDFMLGHGRGPGWTWRNECHERAIQWLCRHSTEPQADRDPRAPTWDEDRVSLARDFEWLLRTFAESWAPAMRLGNRILSDELKKAVPDHWMFNKGVTPDELLTFLENYDGDDENDNKLVADINAFCATGGKKP